VRKGKTKNACGGNEARKMLMQFYCCKKNITFATIANKRQWQQQQY